jgi:hypothetical protein
MKKFKIILSVLRTILIAIIVVGVGGYLVLIANGYKINSKAKKILQTGMIYLKSDPKQVNVFLNNDLKASKTPVKLENLENGRYDVEVKKDNYQDWQKTLTVENGLVNSEDSIVLFLKNPEETSMSQTELDSFNKNVNSSVSADLEIREMSEIWIKTGNSDGLDKLITRLSKPIKATVYYVDKKHIMFQVENQIRAIDLDGSNNVLLKTLPLNDTAKFYIDSSGAYLLCSQNNVFTKIKIH